MEYRRLGRSGLKVSEIALGTMTFGKGTDEAEAGRILDAALDAGVNFIDTADTYAEGASEAYLGRLLGGIRHELVLATKFNNPTGGGPNDSGSSRAHVVRALEDSLTRLRTDHIDLYYIHHVDVQTPLDETLRALDDLVRAGKVRYIAASNYEAWRLLEGLWLSDSNGWSRFVAYQPQYNLLVRDIEDEIVPVCELKGVGIVAWGPLAGGLLTGKYQGGTTAIPGSRSQEGWGFRDRQVFYHADREAVVATLIELAGELGRRPAAIAIRWLLERAAVSSVIAGARDAAQFADNAAAAGWTLPPEAKARLDAVSAPPPRYPKAFEARMQERRDAAVRFSVRRG
ncbi:aldo/keto reductase [Ancylobacter oerskovii]|uniref:Aldo/keto reductase n=1 Tax=Ancylobacter oerskovii TaxID=459519 RepID=A0ABW4Z1V0_9HYPH|nr:aldo/keto reductase [Ancylobacter oerskovii]MBS7544838.1 aldo/keto reductase [Ancylobacter oerskovii]